jgi:hypothetical protein
MILNDRELVNNFWVGSQAHAGHKLLQVIILTHNGRFYVTVRPSAARNNPKLFLEELILEVFIQHTLDGSL